MVHTKRSLQQQNSKICMKALDKQNNFDCKLISVDVMIIGYDFDLKFAHFLKKLHYNIPI